MRVLWDVGGEYGLPGQATGGILNSDVVGITWVVQEDTPGGNTTDVTLQWNSSAELPNFGRVLSAVPPKMAAIGSRARWVPPWVPVPSRAASAGSAPSVSSA